MNRRLCVVALLVLGGCATMSEPTETKPEVALDQDADRGFVLALHADDPAVGAGEEISVFATIASPGVEAVVMGSSSGLVGFGVTRLEDGLTSGPPGWRSDCREYTVPEQPLVIPFAKSGGWSPEDPDAEFLRTYFSDQALILPPGTWRIDAMANGSIGECGGDPLVLRASIEVVVTE